MEMEKHDGKGTFSNPRYYVRMANGSWCCDAVGSPGVRRIHGPDNDKGAAWSSGRAW